MPRDCRTPAAPTPITVAWRRNSQNGRIRSLVSNPFTARSTGHTSSMAATLVILKFSSTLRNLLVFPPTLPARFLQTVLSKMQWMPIGRNLADAASLEYQALSQASTRSSEPSRTTCWRTCCGQRTPKLKAADDADFREICVIRRLNHRLKSSDVRMPHEG